MPSLFIIRMFAPISPQQYTLINEWNKLWTADWHHWAFVDRVGNLFSHFVIEV